jgi:hypothetical protein
MGPLSPLRDRTRLRLQLMPLLLAQLKNGHLVHASPSKSLFIMPTVAHVFLPLRHGYVPNVQHHGLPRVFGMLEP